MPLEFDIEQTVAGLLRAHGPHAPAEAKQMFDRFLRRKDAKGQNFWQRVCLALAEDLPHSSECAFDASKPAASSQLNRDHSPQ